MAELMFRTLRQEVVDAIRMKILNGELGPGERIVEQEIAADLGVSRGPIREALRQIEQEGLIEYTRNIGCSVKRITEEDIYEIYLLRANYEILAVKLCGGKLSDQCLRDMRVALENMAAMGASDFDASISYDNLFHGCVIQQAGLPRLSHLWLGLNSSNVISYYAGSADRTAAIKRQYPIHKTVLDAYLTGDAKKISKTLLDHYMLTIKRRLAEKGSALEKFHYALDFEL